MKYEKLNAENAGLLKEAFLKWHDMHPERLYINDVLTLPADEDSGPEEIHFKATVKGLTDWYSISVNFNGELIPASIMVLPF